MAWLIGLLLLLVAIHAFMSLRYNYDWIGANVRKFLVRKEDLSVTELYPIPTVPYMDRMGQYTRTPKMKENSAKWV
jgi:hypothetical protein